MKVVISLLLLVVILGSFTIAQSYDDCEIYGNCNPTSSSTTIEINLSGDFMYTNGSNADTTVNINDLRMTGSTLSAPSTDLTLSGNFGSGYFTVGANGVFNFLNGVLFNSVNSNVDFTPNDRVNIKGNLNVTENVTAEDVYANNICYSDGTNCTGGGGGNPFDQSLNTSDNVNFNEILVNSILNLSSQEISTGAGKTNDLNMTAQYIYTDAYRSYFTGRILANGAGTWGSAPFVLGQDSGNHGTVITDKATSNPKNIYFGWEPTGFNYVQIYGLQEGVAWKDLILNPTGSGDVGIGETSPSTKLDVNGNITGDYYFGDGSQLTGISSGGDAKYASVTTETNSIASSSEYNVFQNSSYTGGLTVTNNTISQGINYDIVSGNFTVTNDGTYEINVNYFLETSSTNQDYLIIKVNGANVYRHYITVHTSVDPSVNSITILKTLSVDDTIEIYVDSANSATLTTRSGTTLNIQRIEE